jgi:hypothetical protein
MPKYRAERGIEIMGKRQIRIQIQRTVECRFSKTQVLFEIARTELSEYSIDTSDPGTGRRISGIFL